VNTYVEVLDETLIDLGEPSDNTQVVSYTRHLTGEIGFDQEMQFLIASAASELATNIIRYAGQGQVILRIVRGDHVKGFEILARDSGPGIKDIDEAMKENVSGGNGLGLGLPSVKRIMDEFDIQSEPGSGTTVVARKWRN